MNHNECNIVVNALENYCGNGNHFPGARTFWAIGGTYAYMCDYAGGQLCYRDEAALAYTLTTNVCGSYKVGW